jgi:hypothetical protein
MKHRPVDPELYARELRGARTRATTDQRRERDPLRRLRSCSIEKVERYADQLAHETSSDRILTLTWLHDTTLAECAVREEIEAMLGASHEVRGQLTQAPEQRERRPSSPGDELPIDTA